MAAQDYSSRHTSRRAATSSLRGNVPQCSLGYVVRLGGGRDVGGARNQVRSLSPRAIPFTGDWQEASQSRRAPAAPPPPIGWSGEAGGRDRGSGGVIRTAAAAAAHSRALTAVGAVRERPLAVNTPLYLLPSSPPPLPHFATRSGIRGCRLEIRRLEAAALPPAPSLPPCPA